MGKRMNRQHEVLRVPNGWTEQDKALVMQLERIHDDLYNRLTKVVTGQVFSVLGITPDDDGDVVLTESSLTGIGVVGSKDIGIVETGDTATHNISKGQYVIWKGSLYTASAVIATGDTLSVSNLTAVSNGGLNALDNKHSWKKATWTAWYPTATSTDYHEVSMPELANATEIVGYIGTSGGTQLTPVHLMTFGESRSIYSREFDTKMLAYNSDTYNYSVALKYDKTTYKLGYRQSYKGASSGYQGLVEVWYK